VRENWNSLVIWGAGGGNKSDRLAASGRNIRLLIGRVWKDRQKKEIPWLYPDKAEANLKWEKWYTQQNTKTIVTDQRPLQQRNYLREAWKRIKLRYRIMYKKTAKIGSFFCFKKAKPAK